MSEKLKLSQKIKKLDGEIESLHYDNLELEATVKKYKAAVELAKDIEKDLSEIKNEVEIISQDFSK